MLPRCYLLKIFSHPYYTRQVVNRGCYQSFCLDLIRVFFPHLYCVYDETHQAIYNLRAIEAYTPPQIELITDAFLQNNQLNWISSDPDVLDLFL